MSKVDEPELAMGRAERGLAPIAEAMAAAELPSEVRLLARAKRAEADLEAAIRVIELAAVALRAKVAGDSRGAVAAAAACDGFLRGGEAHASTT